MADALPDSGSREVSSFVGGSMVGTISGGGSSDDGRLYNGPDPLADLAVGGDHVAAYEANTSASWTGRVLWWRGGDRFPAQADGGFRSLISGDGFTCAVETNASAAVRCWGP